MKNQKHSISVLLVDPVGEQDLHINQIISKSDYFSLEKISKTEKIAEKLDSFDKTPAILFNLPENDETRWLSKGSDILEHYELPLLFVTETMDENLFNKIHEITPYGYVSTDNNTYSLLQTLKTALQLFESKTSQESGNLADQELNILATTFSKIAGQELFDEVCRHLVERLNLDYAFIGELVDGDNQINVHSIYGEGEFKDPFNYSLEGTPCANVAGQGVCCISSEVCEQFPDDQLLIEMEIEGYVGMPLFSSSDEPLGIAVLLKKEPIEDPERCKQFLQIYSDRVSTEMERIRAEKALRERKRALSSINKNITEGIYRSTPNDGLVYINQAFADMFGYDRQELIDLEGPEMYANEERREELRKLENENGYIKNEEVQFKRKDGSTFWALMSGTIVYDDHGEVKYYDGSVLDITERKKTQEENRRLLEAIQQSPVSIIITDTEGKIEYVNPQFANKSSESKDNVIEIIAQTMDKEKHGAIHEEIWETIQDGRVWKGVIKTSEEIWEEATISPVFDEDDEIINFITICEDITQRKMHEEQLEQSIKEKEVLLAEIHHRVKNNLAVISGLLELQKFNTSDPLLRDVLKNTSNRIQSIANVHELLYHTEDFSNINLQTQIEKLCEEISKSYHKKSQTISFNIEASEVQLNANQAITFGLLLNELINNSFKHAFPNNEHKGTITIKLTQDKEHIYLTYSDNGVGISDNVQEVESEDSLGFTLINTLAKQLDALNTDIKNGEGFTFGMVFEKIDNSQIGSLINNIEDRKIKK